MTPRRLLKLVSRGPKKSGPPPAYAFPTEEPLWTMGGFYALTRHPFDELLVKKYPALMLRRRGQMQKDNAKLTPLASNRNTNGFWILRGEAR